MTYASDRIKVPQGLWTSLRELGYSPQEIAHQAQLPLAIIEEPEGVAAAQYFAIWQAYANLVGDVSQAIIMLSTAFDTAHYPPSVLATYHARDYRDALKRMAMYKQLCPPERLRITEEGESCRIELNGHAIPSGPAVLMGITLATLLELGRRGTGKPIQAKLVEFSNPMGEAAPLEAYFGCQIRFGAKGNRLTLHRRDLDLPFLSYNEELLEILTPALERTLDERSSDYSIVQAVQWVIKRCLAGSRPDMRTVARELGMSERTLQRRLTSEGTSFKQILSQVRHDMALNYLADPVLDIKEIAFLLGYEDQNSFYRTFRAWEGDTPSNWRIRHKRS